jgi:outer membrane protein assembly factor BamB
MRLLSVLLLTSAFLQPMSAGLLANAQGNNTTRAYETSFAGPLSGGYLGVAVDGFGGIFVADALGDILRYSSTGTYLGVFGSLPASQFDVFNGIAFGPDGKLYAATTGDRVFRFDSNGANRTELVGTADPLSGAYGLTSDGAGNLYVASYNSKQILKYTSAGTLAGSFVSGVTLQSAAAPTFGPGGKLYVSDYLANKVHRFDGSTGAWEMSMAVTAALSGPVGLAFDPAGTLYVASLLNDRILTYNSSTGAYLGIYQSSATDAGLLSPTYLAYIADLAIAALGRRRALS